MAYQSLLQKHDDDYEGGQTIHEASMAAMQEHLHSLSLESDDGVSELVLTPVPLSVPQANVSLPTSGSSLVNANTNSDANVGNDKARSPVKQSEKPKKKCCEMDCQSNRSDGVLK
jgi:hypothetical protein